MATEGTNNTLPNNIGASEGEARKEYYIRELPTDPLFGPLTYQHANAQARLASKENDTGVIELVTIVGERPSDPKGIVRTFIVGRYVRGRLTLGGRVAEYNSGK